MCVWLLFQTKAPFAALELTFYGKHKQARNQGKGRRSPPRKFVAPLGKMCWILFKNIGHGSKKFGSSQKTLCPSWFPKLVTGLRMTDFSL